MKILHILKHREKKVIKPSLPFDKMLLLKKIQRNKQKLKRV